MCTAISLTTQDHYFGRNLDLESTFHESVVITPRRFPFVLRRMPPNRRHLAMIGMASIVDGYPLYYDATNETGLSAAALNFPGNAFYPPQRAENCLAPYELIPFLLASCCSVRQVRELLTRISLAAIPFSDDLPLSPLHFLISDRHESLVVEPMKDGLCLHDNPFGVLTNNPPFGQQEENLSRYMALTNSEPENRLAPSWPLHASSRGMGAIGLPGDLSSPSRFVRAAFMKAHSLCGGGEEESVTQFFHILASVAHPRGSVLVRGKPEITQYSSCCNTTRGVYYYTTYENRQITAIDMHRENLDAESLSSFPLIRTQQIRTQNI